MAIKTALIVGAKGQLGLELVSTRPDIYDCVQVDHGALDIGDRAAVFDYVRRVAPMLILNAAGYTNVDRAETEIALAFSANAEGPANLAEAAHACAARLIHVSSNYVFGGDQCSPIKSSSEAKPINAYGRSKIEGERRIARLGYQDVSVVRAGWLYSAHGNNFLTRMLKLMQERDEISVVNDQFGTPTTTSGLARAIWKMAQVSKMIPTWHWADAGQASWYEFAEAICDEARNRGLVTQPVAIVPVSSQEYQTPARRPHYAVLDYSKAAVELGINPVSWREALAGVMREIAATVFTYRK